MSVPARQRRSARSCDRRRTSVAQARAGWLVTSLQCFPAPCCWRDDTPQAAAVLPLLQAGLLLGCRRARCAAPRRAACPPLTQRKLAQRHAHDGRRDVDEDVWQQRRDAQEHDVRQQLLRALGHLAAKVCEPLAPQRLRERPPQQPAHAVAAAGAERGRRRDKREAAAAAVERARQQRERDGAGDGKRLHDHVQHQQRHRDRRLFLKQRGQHGQQHVRVSVGMHAAMHALLRRRHAPCVFARPLTGYVSAYVSSTSRTDTTEPRLLGGKLASSVSSSCACTCTRGPATSAGGARCGAVCCQARLLPGARHPAPTCSGGMLRTKHAKAAAAASSTSRPMVMLR